MSTDINIGFKREYKIWLWAYMLANVLATIIMYYRGSLVGDVEGEKIYDYGALFIASALVVSCYYVLLKPFYNLLMSIKVPHFINVDRTERSDLITGRIILVLQVLFFLFNWVNGVNTAGSSARTDSIFSTFWVFVPIDIMVLIYYSLHRDDKMFKYNVGVYAASNIIRGWAGVFLFLIFFEWCRAVRRNKVNFTYIIFGGILLLFIYPYLHYMKLVIRSISYSGYDISMFFQFFKEALSQRTFAEFVDEGLGHLVGRLQHVSIVVEIMHYKDLLQESFSQGKILPFWQDGLPQLTYRKVLGISAPPNLGVALTGIFFPNGDLGFWNINSGFVGWFFVVPDLLWLYLFYMFFLCALSVFLMKQFERLSGSYDSLWLAWLIFLITGWHMAFVGFIYCILLFIAIRYISRRLSYITWNNKE